MLSTIFITLTPRQRAILWIVLLITSTLLVLSNVKLIPIYHAIQAPYIFNNFGLFSFIYILWCGILLVLLFSNTNLKKTTLENLVLINIFVLVFAGFWILITPYSSWTDSLYNLAHVKRIINLSVLDIGNANFRYFDFPSLHIIASILYYVTEINLFTLSNVFLLVNICFFTTLLYLFYINIFTDIRIASLCCLLTVEANAVLTDQLRIFYPGILGFTFLIAILYLIVKYKGTNTNNISSKAILLLMFCASIISYFSVPFLLLITLVILFIQKPISKVSITSATFVISIIVIFIAWEIFYVIFTFNNLVGFIPYITKNIFSGQFLSDLTSKGFANIGSRIPLWANVVRILWWVTIYGIGTIIALVNILKIRMKSLSIQILTFSTIGLLIMTVIGLVGTRGGEQFARFLQYGTLFCAPLLIFYLIGKDILQKIFPFILIILFLLSLPSFLAANNNVATDAYYPSEHCIGVFMESNFDKGNNLDAYAVGYTLTALGPYYLPESNLKYTYMTIGLGENDLWPHLNGKIDSFENTAETYRRKAIFLYNYKSKVPYQHLMAISDTDYHWAIFEERLNDSDLIYSNNSSLLYYRDQYYK